jgi:hypothetical protein
MLSDLGGEYFPANDNAPPGRIIVIPSDEILSRPATVRRLAVALGAIGISRRRVPDFLCDVIFGNKLTVRYTDGFMFCKCSFDVDTIFGEGSMRWISDFLKFAVTPPKQRAQTRTLHRLRVIALALLIARPEVMEHVLA